MCSAAWDPKYLLLRLACLLMQDIGKKLITPLSNDSCINIQFLVAVTFNMREKILKI